MLANIWTIRYIFVFLVQLAMVQPLLAYTAQFTSQIAG